MNPTPLLLALIGHLVGDYLLQNDWMAAGKKKSPFICCIHALIWSVTVCWFAGWENWWSPLWTEHPIAWTWLILFWTHFIQDHTNIIPWWMDLIGQKQFKKSDEIVESRCRSIETGWPIYTVKPGLGPWSVIVVDNIFHILTIWAVWRFVA